MIAIRHLYPRFSTAGGSMYQKIESLQRSPLGNSDHYSASGCFSGAAFAKAGNIKQVFSMLTIVGYCVRSQP